MLCILSQESHYWFSMCPDWGPSTNSQGFSFDTLRFQLENPLNRFAKICPQWGKHWLAWNFETLVHCVERETLSVQAVTHLIYHHLLMQQYTVIPLGFFGKNMHRSLSNCVVQIAIIHWWLINRQCYWWFIAQCNDGAKVEINSFFPLCLVYDVMRYIFVLEI